MAFSNRVAQLDGLEIFTVTVLAERDARGGLRVIKVVADGIPVVREYGGVNADQWVAVNAAGQLTITVKEEQDGDDEG